MIRPFLNVPTNLREWTRFLSQAEVTSTTNAPIQDADIPSSIARDGEVAAGDAATLASANSTSAAALAAHVAAADPHTGYQKESEKDQPAGYAGLNANSRTTAGVITTDDLIVNLSTKGLILKDSAGTPHFWRISVSTLGVLTTTDLGTSPP